MLKYSLPTDLGPIRPYTFSTPSLTITPAFLNRRKVALIPVFGRVPNHVGELLS